MIGLTAAAASLWHMYASGSYAATLCTAGLTACLSRMIRGTPHYPNDSNGYGSSLCVAATILDSGGAPTVHGSCTALRLEGCKVHRTGSSLLWNQTPTAHVLLFIHSDTACRTLSLSTSTPWWNCAGCRNAHADASPNPRAETILAAAEGVIRCEPFSEQCNCAQNARVLGTPIACI